MENTVSTPLPPMAPPTKLTDFNQQEEWHDWTPDGKWLTIDVFDSLQTPLSHRALVNWHTRQLTILTDTTFRYQQHPWYL
ncbi:MAG: hypothetical protein R3C61_04165 [Bacteroidia bacterium]